MPSGSFDYTHDSRVLVESGLNPELPVTCRGGPFGSDVQTCLGPGTGVETCPHKRERKVEDEGALDVSTPPQRNYIAPDDMLRGVKCFRNPERTTEGTDLPEVLVLGSNGSSRSQEPFIRRSHRMKKNLRVKESPKRENNQESTKLVRV